jgi:hypothetical protein
MNSNATTQPYKEYNLQQDDGDEYFIEADLVDDINIKLIAWDRIEPNQIQNSFLKDSKPVTGLELPDELSKEIPMFKPNSESITSGFDNEYKCRFNRLADQTYFKIKELGDLYRFVNPVQLFWFLMNKKNLYKALSAAHYQIKKIFGKSAPVICLEYRRDPEEDFETVAIVIKTSSSTESSLELLDRFDNEWWLNQSEDIRLKLVVLVSPL